jgi:stearoyl-CoA desaturase (delta-9 desaturase)
MVAPLGLLGFAAWRAWGGDLRWSDLVVLAVVYCLTGLGVTVGFHRLFTHRSFKTAPPLRFLLAVLGSAAIEGPLIEWVSNHRKHHQFSDATGDPHSPHHHGKGVGGALRGLLHAHVGWILKGDATATPERYAKDLLADPVARLVDRTFLVWLLLGLTLPFALGAALTGTWAGALGGLLWGGAVRIFLLHHATFSINSVCHFFGRQPTRRATSRATSRGSRSQPSARRGTTTITPSQAPPATAAPAGSSIRRGGRSRRSQAAGSPGTSSRRPPRAS